jgi:hypothetical protein
VENEHRGGGEQDQLEEHSLPGTKQAGRGPVLCEETDQENSSGRGGSQQQEQLEEHSLPGTNHAGKGSGSSEKNS